MIDETIFISYSKKDKSIAEKVHKILEANDYGVWRDNRLERDWSKEIANALLKCDALCVIWTDSSSRSRWVIHECLTARALGKYIILCIFPDPPTLPEPLQNLHGIKCKKSKINIKRKLIKNIDSFKVTYDYSNLPEKCKIPFNRERDFFGRDQELADIYSALIGDINKPGRSYVGIYGMGGIGKTLLTIEFVYRFNFVFNEVYWIQGNIKEEWEREFVQLVTRNPNLVIDGEITTDNNEQRILGLQRYFRLNQLHKPLVIMDDVTEPEFLNAPSFLSGATPLTLGCNLLFTTRQKFRLPSVSSIHLKELQPDYAYSLLTVKREPDSMKESNDTHLICTSTGYHPLALSLISAYLSEYPAKSFSDYYQLLINNGLSAIDCDVISDLALSTRRTAAIGITLKIQWDKLKD